MNSLVIIYIGACVMLCIVHVSVCLAILCLAVEAKCLPRTQRFYKYITAFTRMRCVHFCSSFVGLSFY